MTFHLWHFNGREWSVLCVVQARTGAEARKTLNTLAPGWQGSGVWHVNQGELPR